MKKTISLVLFFIILFSLAGCSRPKLEVTETKNYISYINACYGKHKRNYFDLCIPKTVGDSAGVIFVIHGGGWIAGDKDGMYDFIKNWCERGYITAALNYRYANGKNVTTSDILEDITNCLSELKSICEQNGITPTKAMFYGGSAGAHLCLQYAYQMAEVAPIKPGVVFSLCGPTDLTDPNFYKDGELGDDIRSMISKISGQKLQGYDYVNYTDILLKSSPIALVTENCVPTVLCHGVLDDVVPYSNAVALDKKLTEYGVKHDFITYPNSGHGLESDPDCTKRADELFEEYASTYLS